MNDAERDAWLREALRHAPDADAVPPRDISDTILAQARAAARQGQTSAPRLARRNPLAALWDWLARPPVAAGFASVMAATLVGLMWWDRPMDETLARSPSVASERAQAPAASVVAPATGVTPPAEEERAAIDGGVAADTTRAAPAARPAEATAPLARSARRQGSEGAAARDAKVEAREANAQAPEAKEQRKLEAADEATRPARTAAKPSPFPRSDDERVAAAPSPSAKKKDADDKDGAAAPAAANDAVAPNKAALAKSLPEAAPARVAPAETLRSAAAPPAAFARKRSDEPARPSPANSGDGDAAKNAAAAAAATAPAPAAPTLRDGAMAQLREKQASAFTPSPSPQTRNEVASAQRESSAAAPLAPLLAALASEPARWSRATASGSVVALDAGWRDWLMQLDSAAAGRWQPSAEAGGGSPQGANAGERDGAATLRLVDGGRVAAVVRLDGMVVRVDGLGGGEGWQATLPAAAAGRLRAAATRLAP